MIDELYVNGHTWTFISKAIHMLIDCRSFADKRTDEYKIHIRCGLTAPAGRRVALLVDIHTVTVRTELNRGGFLGLRINQTGLDISGQCEKCLLHTFVCFCTSLQEPQSKLVGKRTPLLNRNRSLLLPVALVTDKNLVDAGRCMLFNVGEPGPDVVEGLFVCNVIDQQDTHGTSVVSGSDGSETFLPSSIPNLQLDSLPIELDCSDLKVNTDGGDERRSPGILTESQEET